MQEDEMQNIPYPFPAQSFQESNRESLILHTAPERIAELMEHHLRGEIWDDEDKRWVLKRTPMMNDEGIDSTICMVKFFLNQNSTLSNMDEKRISNQVIGFGTVLAKSFAMNTKKWALDKKIRSVLLYSIVATIWNALSRSLGKTISDKELYQGTIQSRELIHIQQQQQQKKGLGTLFSRKKPDFQRMV